MYPAMKHAIIALLLLCGCGAEDLAAEAPRTAERTATDDDVKDLDVSNAAGICPTGSDPVCNQSGDCRCCWPAWQMCCPRSEPYIRCNFSGDCRCSDIP